MSKENFIEALNNLGFKIGKYLQDSSNENDNKNDGYKL